MASQQEVQPEQFSSIGFEQTEDEVEEAKNKNFALNNQQKAEEVEKKRTLSSTSRRSWQLIRTTMLNSHQLSIDVQNHLPPSASPTRTPVTVKMPSPKYARWSEILRRVTNANFQCSVFCGGKKCKYETFKNWRENERDIPVIFSNWITADILAMARPNNQIIQDFNLIEYFKSANIKTIINLQQNGEHASCGPTLDESGFSYDPKKFMDKQIYFYNFSWKDYSAVSELALLDMVKVVAFALSQGKVAIHCHAGLGRTGVLISAYLIFTYRCQAQSAIKFVRSKRPNSVQSRAQIASLLKFANFLSPCFIVYKSVYVRELLANELSLSDRITSFLSTSKTFMVNLSQYLARQRCLLHGEELRSLRYIPKILFIISEKVIQIAGKESVLSHQQPRMATPSRQNTLQPEVVEETGISWEENFTRKFLSVRLTEGVSTIGSINGEREMMVDDNISDSMWENFSVSSHGAFSEINSEFEDDSFLIDSFPANDDVDFNNGPLRQNIYEDDEDVHILSSETLQHHRSSFEMLKKSFSNSSENLVSIDMIVQSLIKDYTTNFDDEFQESLVHFQKIINSKPSGWEKVCGENDLDMLVALFWSWFDNLDVPILTEEFIILLSENSRDFSSTFFKLDIETRYTLEYLIRFIIRLTRNEQNQLLLLNHLMAFLTMKRIPYESEYIRSKKESWPSLPNHQRAGIEKFFQKMIDLINQVSTPL